MVRLGTAYVCFTRSWTSSASTWMGGMISHSLCNRYWKMLLWRALVCELLLCLIWANVDWPPHLLVESSIHFTCRSVVSIVWAMSSSSWSCVNARQGRRVDMRDWIMYDLISLTNLAMFHIRTWYESIVLSGCCVTECNTYFKFMILFCIEVIV